jgi:hypothetical protein
MIAFMIIIYTALVLVLFKVLHIKPTAYLIASLIVAGLRAPTCRCIRKPI